MFSGDFNSCGVYCCSLGAAARGRRAPAVKREQAKEEGELLLDAMLKQEELAFIKAVGSMELSRFSCGN
jgi:hypothetical protein